MKRELLELSRSSRFRVVLAAAVLVGVLHQSKVLRDLPIYETIYVAPYLPIILGALWFGLRGGITTALATSACYLTYVLFREPEPTVDVALQRSLNILMFNVVGFTTGRLAQAHMDSTLKYKRLAQKLGGAHVELKRKVKHLAQAEDKLLQANRLSLLGELTADLIHEIGNPLEGIKGAAEIVMEDLGPDYGKAQFLRLILDEAARLDGTVSRFLESVRQERAPEARADLSEVIAAAVSLVGQTAKGGKLRLETRVEHSLPSVTGDPHRLRQVFLNLLLNAIQATSSKGTVIIEARQVGSVVECRVIDTGAGIEPTVVRRLFDPFFTTRPEGTGLGLSICRKIVRDCGGEIRVDSRPGRGTVFTVALRVHSDE